MKLVFRGRLSDSAPSSPDLRLPLPAGPDQLFPPSAAYTRGEPYIKSVFLHNRPCMFFPSLQSAGPRSSFPAVEIARGEPTAASLAALCVRLAFFLHKTANKQCGNKKRGMRGE